MRLDAAARRRLPILSLVLVPVMFHLAIVRTSQVRLGLAPHLAVLFKLGFVSAAALMHWAIYASLLLTFGLTLRPGREPLITAMARRLHGSLSHEMHEGSLSREMIVYTRRVTIAWCGFFAAQLTISVLLFVAAPLVVWSFFVNILDIPLVGAMFAAEYMVRLRCLRDPPRHTLAAIAGMIADVRKPRERTAGLL